MSRYRQAELIRATLRDLLIDLRCARRDGHHDYAEYCERSIRKLWPTRFVAKLDNYGWPKTLK